MLHFNQVWNNNFTIPVSIRDRQPLANDAAEEGCIVFDLSGSTEWDPNSNGYTAKRLYGKIISHMHTTGVFKKAKKWHIFVYGTKSEYIGCKVAALVHATLTRTIKRS